MFESLGLISILLLSALLWFVGGFVPYLFNQKISSLGVAPLILFSWLFQGPLTERLKNMDQAFVGPAWVVTVLKFLQTNPIIPVLLILLVFGIAGLRYLGLLGDNNDRIKKIIILLSIIPSFIFPLMSSRLIPAGWTAGLAIALLVEFLAFYFCKRKMVG